VRVFASGLLMTTSTASPAFQRLETEGRLLKPTLMGLTHVPGRYGFRDDLALSLNPPVALEAAMAVAEGEAPTLSFLAGSLASMRLFPQLVEALGDNVSPAGKYFIYVADLGRASRYQMAFKGVTYYVLPIDDTSVYNELIDYLYLDKTKMKKMDTAEKIDTIAQGALKYSQTYETISYEQGQQRLSTGLAPGRPVSIVPRASTLRHIGSGKCDGCAASAMLRGSRGPSTFTGTPKAL